MRSETSEGRRSRERRAGLPMRGDPVEQSSVRLARAPAKLVRGRRRKRRLRSGERAPWRGEPQEGIEPSTPSPASGGHRTLGGSNALKAGRGDSANDKRARTAERRHGSPGGEGPEGRKPGRACGMKQAREAAWGANRREVEKT